jgi:hypothetical protein
MHLLKLNPTKVTDTMKARVNNRAGRRPVPRALVLIIALCCAGLVQGQSATPWSDLSPAEQQLLQQVQPRWESLSSEQQERLRRGAARWQQMAPEERNQARQQQNFFQQLSPDQRELIQQRFRQFNDVPQGQQQRLRDIQRQFRELPQPQRDALRQRFETQHLQRTERPQGQVLRPDALQRPEVLQNRPDSFQRPSLQDIPRSQPPRIERPNPQGGMPQRPGPAR